MKSARFVELGGEANGAVGDHADFFAQLAQHGVARVLAFAAAASGQAPAGRVAEPDEDDAALGSQGEGVGSEGARAAHEPAQLQQSVRKAQRQAKHSVERGCHLAWTCAKVENEKGARMSGKSKLSKDQYEQLLKPHTKELSAMARWV